MNDMNQFVGIPFRDKGDARDGASCWGLVCLVYRELLSIVLPTYTERYASFEERQEVARIIAGASTSRPWQSILPGDERPFDVVIFRRAGIDAHTGIVVDRGTMLHVASGAPSCVERYDTGKWRSRLAGFVRHADVR